MTVENPVVRSAVCRAPAATIWRECFADPSTWPQWDEDLSSVTDVTGPLEDGTRMTFEMKKDGAKFPMSLSGVETHRQLTFAGSFACGLASARGHLVLTPEGEHTRIQYTFGMGGLMGRLLFRIYAKEMIDGTEKGLENICSLSEKAAGTK